MARKNCTPEENARREKIRELLQMANISSMDDIQNLFKETIAEFMENSLEAELDDELGYSKYDYKNKKHRQQPQRPQQQNTAEDWKDLAHAVSQQAVLLEGVSTVSLSFSYMRNTYALPPHQCKELHLTKSWKLLQSWPTNYTKKSRCSKMVIS